MLWRNKIEHGTIYSPIHLPKKAYKETQILRVALSRWWDYGWTQFSYIFLHFQNFVQQAHIFIIKYFKVVLKEKENFISKNKMLVMKTRNTIFNSVR